MAKQTKEQWVAEANAWTRKMRDDERAHERARQGMLKARRRALLEANRAGARYPELVAQCGISDGYLTQQLRAARAEAPQRLVAKPTHRSARTVRV